ncbi:MAG: toll/interleukin-1 receptor domain-containing protein [Pirellulaceae bacterium]
MAKIFLCYRRAETHDICELIYERLVEEFGYADENGQPMIVRDVHTIPLGRDFREYIDRSVAQCNVMLVVIGSEWLRILNERKQAGGPDYVLAEIGSALRSPKIGVVPLLVHQAELPSAEQLPEELGQLPYRNGMTVRQAPHLKGDMKLVTERLRAEYSVLPTPADTPVVHAGRSERTRRQGRRALLGAGTALVGLALWDRPWTDPTIDRSALKELLRGHCWVGYDPAFFASDEEDGPLAAKPTREQEAAFVADIDRELSIIRKAGFTGVVTFGSNGPLMLIPERANRLGLKVIMGVWEPRDRTEVARALAQCRFVDAYCVGYNGLRDGRYVLPELNEAMRALRRNSLLPVTTTEPIIRYPDDEQLWEIGDWLFPDAHSSLRERDTWTFELHPEADARAMLDDMRKIAPIAQRLARPLAFNAVAYPHDGIADASPQVQRTFFFYLLEALRDAREGLGERPALVAHSAFDAPWKSGPEFYDWSSFVGLIDDEGKARPAARELTSRFRRARRLEDAL